MSSQVEVDYHSRIPLGIEALDVGSGRLLYVLASAQNAEFDNWKRLKTGNSPRLVTTSGAPVKFYPSTLMFRVTVTARAKLINVPSFPVDAPDDLNDYLLRLRFQVKLFRGLRQKVVRPENVELIGVPADVPYDERVYLVSFRLPPTPIEDRVVLEVLSASDARVGRFHLDIY